MIYENKINVFIKDYEMKSFNTHSMNLNGTFILTSFLTIATVNVPTFSFTVYLRLLKIGKHDKLAEKN